MSESPGDHAMTCRPEMDGGTPQELTPAQKERMLLNKKDALARRKCAFASNGFENTNPGWRTVQKRPVDEPVAPPCQRQKGRSLPPSLQETHVEVAKALPLKNKQQVQDSQMKPSMEQMKALSAIALGKSVFLTGSAGTGKSFVLQYAIRQLRIMHGTDAVFVTASTGLAACSIGGTTIHSFAGIGLGLEPKETLVDKVTSRRESRGRWTRAAALVIDEISMVDGELFDKLDYIARQVRKKDKPFGGLQLVVTGDFFQLPPVNDKNRRKIFAFEASCWMSCFQLKIEFNEVFRQTDSGFICMLNEIRKGQCSSLTLKRLHDCANSKINTDDGVMLTKLYPKKVDVQKENEEKLQKLNGPEMIYNAKDTGTNEKAIAQLNNTGAAKEVALRVGAQVMLVKNLDTQAGLANGARGVVVGFCDPNDPGAAQWKHLAPSINPSGMWPVVRFASLQAECIIGPESWGIEEGGLEVAKRCQVPLALAWALSVHKCQGMTLDRMETDLSNAFDYGMVYVALSRVKSLEGLRVLGFDPSKIKVHSKVAQFYEELGQPQ